MKKVTLLLLAFLSYAGICFSQDLVFMQNDVVIENGSVITISDPAVLAEMMVLPHIVVKNNSSENIVATLVMSLVEAPKNGLLSVCGWGTEICKPISFGFPESRTTTIASGATEDPLVDVFATNANDVDVYAEYLLEYKGTQQKIYLHVTSNPTSVDNVEANHKTSVYQRDGFTFLEYDFADTTTRYLNIYDITGKKVDAVLLSNDKGNIQLPAPHKGIFIYSVTENGKVVASNKYIVKH